MDLSAVLNVHNEEEQLAACLETLDFADEIVIILDKCTDRSKEIAERFGARIEEGAWEFEGERRNRGIELAEGRWIFEIDADERVPPALAEEIRRLIAGDAAGAENAKDAKDSYAIPVDNYVGGRHIKYGWAGNFGKSSYVGLFRRGTKSWGGGRVHPGFTISGEGGTPLTTPIVHHIDRDISDMLRRVDSYTTARAADLADLNELTSYPETIRKSLSWFIRSYLSKRGYREGAIGLAIAICVGLYPLLSQLKARLEVLPARPDGEAS